MVVPSGVNVDVRWIVPGSIRHAPHEEEAPILDGNHFDAFVRSFRLVPRRTTIGALLGAGLAALTIGRGPLGHDAEAKKRRNKRCRGGKKTCRNRCIPKEDCCTDANCGENERCAGGTCETCLGQGTDCTDDAQCCTGICDTYTDKCQQVRVNCESNGDCPNGRCCDNNQCLYVTATQRECVPDASPSPPNASCGYVVCGDRCSDLSDGTYQFCGFEGSAACRNGRCCCPKGIPLEECPNIQSGTGGFLPRCP